MTATLNGVADDGEAGERDDVGGDVEGIEGGAGADLLAGRDGPQRIDGGPGGDVIDPGRGLDDVRAGPGDDTVRALDGTSEWVHCGDGRDTMSGDFDDLPVRCERTTLSAAPPGADRRKPKVKLDSLPRRPRYAHVRRGLRPRVSADEPVSYVIELLGVARSAHISAAPYNLVLVRKTLKRTSRPRRVTLRPKIALLGPRRKLRVRIRVTARTLRAMSGRCDGRSRRVGDGGGRPGDRDPLDRTRPGDGRPGARRADGGARRRAARPAGARAVGDRDVRRGPAGADGARPRAALHLRARPGGRPRLSRRRRIRRRTSRSRAATSSATNPRATGCSPPRAATSA